MASIRETARQVWIEKLVEQFREKKILTLKLKPNGISAEDLQTELRKHAFTATVNVKTHNGVTIVSKEKCA